jgi:membrane protease YdiL (CAAX protease family)
VDNYKPFVYFVFIYVLTNLILNACSGIILFQGQQWNWAGKCLALAVEILFVLVISPFPKSIFSISKKVDWSGTRPLLILCFIYIVFRIGMYATSGEASLQIHPETTLYQATLPGLQEELLYRGILLGLINTVFIHPGFRFLNVNFGLSTMLTSLLFGLAHGLSLTVNLTFSMNFFVFARAAFDGFLFALLTEKTKSLLPGMVFHNVGNLIGLH